MLRLNEPVPTPDGWKAHGDLRPGDAIFGPDGQPTLVVAISPIYTDNVAYDLEFDDGTRMQVGAAQLWAIERKCRTRIPGTFREGADKRIYRENVTLTAREIADHDHRVDNRLAIRINAPLDLPEAILPIDPYVLGAWLGDGSTNGAVITMLPPDAEPLLVALQAGGHSVTIQPTGSLAMTYRIDGRHQPACLRGHVLTPDNLYRDTCRECRRQRQRQRLFHEEMDPVVWHSLGKRLLALNVIRNKHIPTLYLRASMGQRLQLLRGLMDTDGNCNTRGTATFVNKCGPLIDGGYELAASLGMKPSKYQFEAYHGTYWHVAFQAYGAINPFAIPRKAIRAKQGARPHPRRFIVACRPIEPVPMRCIQVDRADGLYLVGRQMVTTHNSRLGTGRDHVVHSAAWGKIWRCS